MEQSGGSIAVYSEPGHGTTFKIILPRIQEDAATIEPAAPAMAPQRGSERVLVVEDEDMVRTLICEILESEGYKILQARNGGEALLVCEQHSEKMDLMISDITMPGMNGIDLASRLSTIRPDMKVLLMSGYAEKAMVHQRVLAPGVPFLEKPFVPKALAQKVREVLDGS